MRMPSSNPWSNSSPRSATSNKAPCRNCSPARSACRGFEVKPGYKQTEVGVIPADWEARLHREPRSTSPRAAETLKIVSMTAEYPFFVRSQTVERINSYSFDGRSGSDGGRRSWHGQGDSITSTANSTAHQRVYRDLELQRVDKTATSSTSTSAATSTAGSCRLTAKSSVDSVPQGDDRKNARSPSHPPRPNKTAIAAILSDMDAEIAALEAKLAKARQLKQGMMQELLTGRIRPRYERHQRIEWASDGSA